MISLSLYLTATKTKPLVPNLHTARILATHTNPILSWSEYENKKSYSPELWKLTPPN